MKCDIEARYHWAEQLLNAGDDRSAEGLKWLRMSAEARFPMAMEFLGRMYLSGMYVEKNAIRGCELCRQAAKEGLRSAQTSYADCCKYGWGMEQDLEKAAEWYKKSAEHGDVGAMQELAELLLEGDGVDQDVDRAVDLFKNAAVGGVAKAQFMYGSIMLQPQGVGVEDVMQDVPSGIEWIKKAAEQSLGMAECTLAAFYVQGVGVEKDLAKAKELCERALEHGGLPQEMEDDAKALLENLKGVPSVACSDCQGMNPGASDSEKAEFKVLIKTACEGDSDSQYSLAVAFALGRRGAVKDRSRAVEWYEKAANAGKVEAIVGLADCYKDGDVSNKGITDAIPLYEKAASQGDWRSQHLLAEIYSSDEFGQKDYAKAVKWALLAAENDGTADVLCLLGRCFENGLGIEKNIAEAIKNYQRAAQKDNEEAKSALERLGGAYGDTLYGQVKFGPGVTEQDKVACRKIYSETLAGSVGAEYEMGNILSKGMYGILIDKKEAFGWYLKAAECGHAYAQNEVASWYSIGIKDVVDWNDEEKFKWYWEAACQQHPEAMRKVADCFYYGSGVDEDDERAKWWYVRAAKAGDEEASNMLRNHWKMGDDEMRDSYGVIADMPPGMDSEGDDSSKKHFRELFEKAQRGDVEAQFNLGHAFVYGEDGAIMNEHHGVMWLCKAAEQGNGDAENLLGDCYDNGWGVDEDQDEAVKHYIRAADKGNVEAAEEMGRRYRRGRSVEKDMDKAYRCYLMGAEAGREECQFWVGQFFAKGLGNVAKDLAKAFEWYMKSAESGDVDAICAVGWAYQRGDGVERDYAKAAEWFQKGADDDDGVCMNNLARLYEEGKGVEQDLEKALELFMGAAENDCVRANYHIGRFYENGIGVDVDVDEAKKWYQKAADADDDDAKEALERLG